MSPWSFSFTAQNQEEMATLRAEFAMVFVVLICGFDGIVCLTSLDYHRLLDEEFDPVEWIKATRRNNEQYTLTGSNVLHPFKVADSDYPIRIYDALDQLDRLELRGRHMA